MPSSVDSTKISVSSDLLSASSVSTEHSIRSSSISNNNQRGTKRFQELKAVVEKAIQNHKTFTVLGPFACIKNALKLRGWIEKFENKQQQDKIKFEKLTSNGIQEIILDDTSEMRNGDHILRSETTVNDIQISRLLRDYCVDFIWTMKNESIKWKRLSSKTFVSRFARADFTTKAGLCSNLRQIHWHYEEGVSMILFPRCYNTATEDEMSAFVKNFRLTACVSLIRLVCENSIFEEFVIFQKNGTIPMSSLEFALKRCREYVAKQQHFDIDQQKSNEKIWDYQWDQFLTCYYKLVHDDEIFACESADEATAVQKECQDLLTQLASHWSQLHLDGTHNLWILKPAAKSRGRGIHIMKKLEDILAKVNSQQGKECRYVTQKYIERPLLIYETKFDIRQWFLITCAYPLTVWMYKESYLRFCSQAFSLMNTHESLHLSNNAVQCKYTNGIRDRNLPDENMWDCYTFQTYLRSKGKSDVWSTIIYPGMRQNIIGTLLASQDTLDTRKGCFELFGADFMLAETFEPWLIEINSGPSMSPSTSVTARMCAQVLDDVIKVVVDRKYDKNADTGMFELIYKQIIPPMQPYMGQNMILRGSKIEDARKNAARKTTYKPKKTNLSKPVPMRLSQSNKQGYIACHCHPEGKGRATKNAAGKRKTNVNQQEKENRALQGAGKGQQEISSNHRINLSSILENLKKVVDADISVRKNEATETSTSDSGIHHLPVVSETVKRKSNSMSNNVGSQIDDAKILPPIEVLSR